MTSNPEAVKEKAVPTRKDAYIFRCKTVILQAKRMVSDISGGRADKHSKRHQLLETSVLASSKTPLWTESEPEERFLLAGKIHNLRLAIRKLDGLEIPAGEVFSFWKHIGRTSRFRGFVVGRELREGCIIPNIGGGLCQISNALYDAALQADFEILERHAHTQVVPGSLAEKGRDATVFWNYVDLRLRSQNAFRIEAKLDGENLTVIFKGEKPQSAKLHQIERTPVNDHSPNSCATCEQGECHRMIKPAENLNFGSTAFLVDEFYAEFDDHIQNSRTANDSLLTPLDGKRFKKANYAWTTNGFSGVNQSLYVTAIRSYKSRKLAAQGKARQLNLLSMYEKLAESYARKLKFDVLHAVVQQNLLPFLWKSGHLGGRTFDVLMTALPMSELQKRLDLAASLHPESTTLGDFRADKELLAAETEALTHARRIITPHSGIASLFPDTAELLNWKLPEIKTPERSINGKPRIVFPASTVGRKGCYEIRDALQGMNITLVLLGPVIEDKDFWRGFDVENGGGDWINNADLVALPAFVEHKPFRLLRAAAAGIPVIASTACGVKNVAGMESIDECDSESLREAICRIAGV